ncbi:MAG: [Lachnospiraceae bacterium]|nr:[FeFe] hydrogenase H-cluster radical SAM maturase HydE [Lachnospiraceae bacterium]
MKNKLILLIDKLRKNRKLSLEEYQTLIQGYSPEIAEYAATEAVNVRQQIYGNKVYVRGLIEISNICKNDCYYCGIRKSNPNCDRYRLSKEEILECCREGYELGFRTFVMQGGEDGYYTDDILCDVVSAIHQSFPDCAITLSMGERNKESYGKLYEAGAGRYLLRHETAEKEHYAKLHPKQMSYENRLKCLKDLKEIGYQVGCGFMVGSPYQSSLSLAMDLKFVEEFQPDMCGIGPFIPHKDTIFKEEKAGSVEMTCYLLSLIRLIYPPVLLPATTALGTLDRKGREKGILSGANVVMPNLSPLSVRKKYELYNNKISSGQESAQGLEELKVRMKEISYEVVCEKGDIIKL